MYKSIFISLLLFTTVCATAQTNNVDYKTQVDTMLIHVSDVETDTLFRMMDHRAIALPTEIDSVTIAYGIFDNRETSGIESSEFWKGATPVPTREVELAKEWTEKKLSKAEVKKLARILQKEKTYNNYYSMLDVDIFIYFHQSDEVVYRIALSSITRDIVVTYDKWQIKNNFGPELEKYISKLLHQKGIWSKSQDFMLF